MQTIFSRRQRYPTTTKNPKIHWKKYFCQLLFCVFLLCSLPFLLLKQKATSLSPAVPLNPLFPKVLQVLRPSPANSTTVWNWAVWGYPKTCFKWPTKASNSSLTAVRWTTMAWLPLPTSASHPTKSVCTLLTQKTSVCFSTLMWHTVRTPALLMPSVSPIILNHCKAALAFTWQRIRTRASTVCP